MDSKQPIDKAHCDTSERDNSTDFARRIFAVPKEEYDKEVEAVKQGKPLKNPFDKKPAKAGKDTAK